MSKQAKKWRTMDHCPPFHNRSLRLHVPEACAHHAHTLGTAHGRVRAVRAKIIVMARLVADIISGMVAARVYLMLLKPAAKLACRKALRRNKRRAERRYGLTDAHPHRARACSISAQMLIMTLLVARIARRVVALRRYCRERARTRAVGTQVIVVTGLVAGISCRVVALSLRVDHALLLAAVVRLNDAGRLELTSRTAVLRLNRLSERRLKLIEHSFFLLEG